ncbi:MAG: hypothetical protein JXQ65_07670 [Candidatus Marinimicrobia bacterium]|nr:hypothetical protein [Candidatus Neomarinimicrobiota bacterium]
MNLIKIAFFFLFFSLSCFSKNPIKILTITEPLSYPKLSIDFNNIIIGDRFYNYHIYSTDKGDLKKSFSLKGQGPGEFPFITNEGIIDSVFWVSGTYKIAFYTLYGKLIRELPYNKSISNCIMIDSNHYIDASRVFDENISKYEVRRYYLLDNEFNKIKLLMSTKIPSNFTIQNNKKNIFMVRGCAKAIAYKDKIIIGSTENGLNFWIYKKDGTLLKKIETSYQPSKISNEGKNEYLEYEFGPLLKNLKSSEFSYTINSHFPSFYNFYVDKSKIYVLHYPEKLTSDQYQSITIIDFDGKLLKKSKITNVDWLQNDKFRHMTIFNNHFYYLKENINNESWELYKQQIE